MNTGKSCPFTIGFALTVIFFAGVNLRLLSRSHEMSGGGICMDCGLPVGFPFTMYQTEFMWGGDGYIASGVFANICVALISAAFFGFVVNRLWRKLLSLKSARSLK